MAPKESDSIYNRVRWILESARGSVARSVNTSQVVANWLVGREIVEEEQKGRKRARYGENLVRELAVRLQADYGTGYNLTNLKLFRKFYVEYPGLAGNQKGYALRNFLLLTWNRLVVKKVTHCVTNQRALTFFTHRVKNPGSRASCIPASRGPTTRLCSGSISHRPALSMRSRRSRTTGRRVNWNGRSTACCTSGWL